MRKRDAVAVLQSDYRISTRRACGLVGHARRTQAYRNKRKDPSGLRRRMRELAAARPRYGYRCIHTLLRREGWRYNIKRVYRLYASRRCQKEDRSVETPLQPAPTSLRTW